MPREAERHSSLASTPFWRTGRRAITWARGSRPKVSFVPSSLIPQSQSSTAPASVTLSAPAKEDFDRFWTGQNGVRALFLMDNLVTVSRRIPFKVYGRALEWGYPMGVGYCYLSLSQDFLLLRLAGLPDDPGKQFLHLLAARTR